MSGPGWRRAVALSLIMLGLSPTWLRDAPRPENHEQTISLFPLPLPSRTIRDRLLGPFTLEAVWAMHSPNTDFGGYSALLAMPDGQLLALSDRGMSLRFSAPGRHCCLGHFRSRWNHRLAREMARIHDAGAFPAAKPLHTFAGNALARFAPIADRRSGFKADYDAEAATHDPASGKVWIAWETTNIISRHDRMLGKEGAATPPAMDWGVNDGPESLVKLADGRFLVLREAFAGELEDRQHEALLFQGDPVAGARPIRFTLSGPEGYRPTDAAQLPDGRVLILMRRLIWPMPPRFSNRIALADPADIREGKVWQARGLAKLDAPLPVDNFEGLAIAPCANGRVTIWLISDDNGAATQRTLLWKLTVDPERL